MRAFYRLSRDWPPGARDYVTLHDRYIRKGGIPVAWDTYRRHTAQGLSVYETARGAMAQWRQTPGSNRYLVRYLIPERSEIVAEKTWGAGHWTLFGDADALAQYLDPEYCEILTGEKPEARAT